MNNQPEDAIRFDDMFEPEFLETVRTRFKEHIKELKDDVFFTDIIKNEIFTSDVWLKVHTKLQSLGVEATENAIAQFLTSNCFNIAPVEMKKEGHEFTQIEKAHIAGYAGFVQMMDDEGYPWEQPEQQALEMFEQTSANFVKTSFEWHMESVTKIYNDMFPEKALTN